MIEAAKKRMLATTLSPNLEISQLRCKRSQQSHPLQFPLSLPSVSNSSAHPITIGTPFVLTYSSLSVDFGLLASIQRSYNQVDTFTFLALTCDVMYIYKQLQIATLHLSLQLAQACPTMQSEAEMSELYASSCNIQYSYVQVCTGFCKMVVTIGTVLSSTPIKSMQPL